MGRVAVKSNLGVDKHEKRGERRARARAEAMDKGGGKGIRASRGRGDARKLCPAVRVESNTGTRFDEVCKKGKTLEWEGPEGTRHQNS